jgi:outer membrane protein assembly factor BamB
MGNGRIYYYSPEKFLACLEAKTGKQLWKTSDPELLKAIGVSGPGYARGPVPERGLVTESFLKCTDKYLFFTGPQRANFVIVSTADGKIIYQQPGGFVHLILGNDGLYAIGGGEPCTVKTATKMSYDTWQTLAKLPPKSQCTRATGNSDSLFYRSLEEGICQVRVSDNQPQHIATMRPPCTDGIVTANGMVYVGPWMCECPMSLYGNIGLSPAGNFNFHPTPDPSRLTPGEGNPAIVKDLPVAPGDWVCYQGDNQRTGSTAIPTPAKVRRLWTSPAAPNGGKPTAPVTAGGLVFWGDEAGTVRAVDAETGKPRWSSSTAGAVFI